MKILYSWLLDYVPYEGTPQHLAEILTDLGLSVESLTQLGAEYKGVVVGKVITCEAVAGSDHLSYCMVNAGDVEPYPIVCGAPNVAAGQTVAAALPGAMLPGGFLITERKLRGRLSRGMICSERELGMSDEHKGILVLPEDCVIGRPVQEYLGGVDWLFDLEVTFNRPDCLSHIGVAREVGAKLGLTVKMPPTAGEEMNHEGTKTRRGSGNKVAVARGESTSDWVSIRIDDPMRAPRYSARIVTGVKVAPSPEWMQRRLKAVGIRPISNVVDVTNYVMMELGHPLHAFDYHLVHEGKIIVRRANRGEKFTTLDNKEHTLSDTDLLIADARKGIALAGVMGGLNSEINDSTKDVLIECAVFEPAGIRITSRDRGIESESSRRFERGVDPELTLFAASRAAYLIQQLPGGEVLQGVVDAYPNKWKRPEIELRSKRVNAILATNLSAEQMRGYLGALCCEQGEPVADEAGTGSAWKVYPPSWRRDLEREIDLIEEIIRLHGYNEVGMAATSRVALEPDIEREQERRATDAIKISLVSLGLHEAICWSLTSAADATALGDGVKITKVINPLSEDLSRLRTSLAPGLLRAVERNLNAGQGDIRLFEWGKCFWGTDSGVEEGLKLGVILTGKIRPESFADQARPIRLADVRGVVEQFARQMKLQVTISKTNELPIYYAMGAAVASGEQGSRLGVFGQISPEMALHFGIDVPVWYIDLDGDLLLHKSGETRRYHPLPRFPSATRDLAFLVEESVEAGALAGCLGREGEGLLENLELFDVYSGKGISDGKKSLAFHLSFRRSDRTLSDSEVDEMIARMVKAAWNATGAELRSI